MTNKIENVVDFLLSGEETAGLKLDLRGVELKEVSLYRKDLTQANFSEAKLVYCNLEETDLTCAIFDSAMISICSFCSADLTGVRITGSWIERVSFYKANLTGAAIFRTGLHCVEFSKANLQSITTSDEKWIPAARASYFLSAYGRGLYFDSEPNPRLQSILPRRLSNFDSERNTEM